MATGVSDDGTLRTGAGVLSKEDVRALFRLMAEVAQGADSKETIMFSGEALATLFESYAEHLVTLMDRWPDLSMALRGDDAINRARRLRKRLLRRPRHVSLLSLFYSKGIPIGVVRMPEAQAARNFILGKGMQILSKM